MKKIKLFLLFVIISFLIIGCVDATDSSISTSTDSSTSISSDTSSSDSNFVATDWTEATHSKKVDPNFTEVFDDTEVKRLDIVITSTNWQSMLDNMTELYGTFGNTTSSTTPTSPTTPPTGAPSGPPTGTTPTAPTNTTTAIITSEEDPIFVPADVYYNDIQWYKVGVRFKGNSSLKTSWESGILKLSFKLDFDEYEDDYPQIDNQRFYGFKKLSLKNNYDDKSLLREKVAADVFRNAGLKVSNTAFYEVYVDHGDGAEYFGLYTLVEEVDDTLIDTQFSSDNGNLYKPEDGSANFVENTFSSDDFEKKTNEDEADWSDIQALFTALHATTRTSDPSIWRANLEAVFDVDSFLKYLAVNGVIQNWDTYGRMIHNYYLYNNPDNNLLTWIPWDNNEAFQEGKLGGSLALHFTNLDANDWPLIEKIYADSTYKAKYDTYIQSVIDDAFNSSTIESKYNAYSSLIETSAQNERDGFSFLGTNKSSDFTTAITELKTHLTSRHSTANTYLGQ